MNHYGKHRVCREKKAYETEEQAQCRANYLHEKVLRLKPYKCPVCQKWHLKRRSKRAVLEQLFEKIKGDL